MIVLILSGLCVHPDGPPLPAGVNCLSTLSNAPCCLPPLSLSSLASLRLSFRPGVVSLYPPHVSLPQTGALGAVLWVMWPSMLQQLSPVLPQKPQVSPQIRSTRTLHRGANRRLRTSSKQQLAVTAFVTFIICICIHYPWPTWYLLSIHMLLFSVMFRYSSCL